MEENDAIVLFPLSNMQSHLVPMIELAKLILAHHPTFSITILILDPPPNSDQHIYSAAKNITFHIFPPIPDTDIPPNLSPSELFFELPRLHKPNIHNTLLSMSRKAKLKAFIIDFFCDAVFEVSRTLGILTYYFFTTNASGLAFFLHIPTLDRESGKSFRDVESPVSVPGLPPIPPTDIPSTIQDRTARIFNYFYDTAIHMTESSGIIVNTFESLEEKPLTALRDGLCVPGKSTPPIFCVGPVVSYSGKDKDCHDQEENCMIMSWLDQQPSKSVVFLCFGSKGIFSAKQLFEMAVGLENSGHRFLWVVRDPARGDDHGNFFPKGFLERTKERGLVVWEWAPQVKILSHDSVGGFVTHCGWNSVLESVCVGVPMLAWPLYAEQRMNRLFLVEEMRVALAVNESGEGDRLVSGAELEERVRELMDSESVSGREVRERVLMMKDAAVNAMGNGGSSRFALTDLIDKWKKNSETLILE